MAEVRKVASDAMKRFNSNLADQQRAKAAAFDLLRTYGHDGHILSQPHLEQQGRTYAPEHHQTQQNHIFSTTRHNAVGLSRCISQPGHRSYGQARWAAEVAAVSRGACGSESLGLCCRGAGGVSPHSPGGGQGQHASSWPALAEQVQTQIAVAISHNDLLQVSTPDFRHATAHWTQSWLYLQVPNQTLVSIRQHALY